MNQPTGDNQKQPTHEAQRVVIPFDIDMSAVERKVEQLERRIKALSVTDKSTVNSPSIEAPPTNVARGTTDQERQLLVITIQQMQSTLREIRDLVQLIYTDSINNG